MLHRGEKAFERLQLEIIKKSNDRSIFAWSLTPKGIFSASYLPNTRGLLSYSPAEFRHCEKILTSTEMVNKPYSITNLGLSNFLLLTIFLHTKKLVLILYSKERHLIATRLEKLDGCRVYIRIYYHHVFIVQTDLNNKGLKKQLADKFRNGMEAESLDVVNKPLQEGNSVSVTIKEAF